MKYNKKGQIQELGALGIGIASLAIVMTIVFLVLSQGKTQLTSMGDDCSNTSMVYNVSTGWCCTTLSSEGCTAGGAVQNRSDTSLAWNSTTEMQNASSTLPGWVPLIVITLIGAILLGLVSKFREG